MIRTGSGLDSPALAALHAICFEGKDRWRETQIAGSLGLETTLCLLAQEGDRIDGFLLAQVVRDEAEILTLCIHPAHRRAGQGEALVRNLLSWPGVSVVFLDVAADNKIARRLYERCGFTVIGFRPGYYKRDESAVDAVNYKYSP